MNLALFTKKNLKNITNLQNSKSHIKKILLCFHECVKTLTFLLEKN